MRWCKWRRKEREAERLGGGKEDYTYGIQRDAGLGDLLGRGRLEGKQKPKLLQTRGATRREGRRQRRRGRSFR
jgi:hypothetical protein